MLLRAKSQASQNPAGELEKEYKEMDPIANFIASIRNANAKGLEKADIPLSKIKIAVTKILKEEGYIAGYRLMEENRKPFIRIQLRYTDDRHPVISGLKRISRPGLRIYEHYRDLSKVDGGMGVSILSTSKGLMTNRKARKLKCGGEVLCHIW